MKKSLLSVVLASSALLGACDHYHERLSALDGIFSKAAPEPSTYATTENAAASVSALPTQTAMTADAYNHMAPAAGAPPAPSPDLSFAAAQQPYNLALAQAYYERAVLEKNVMDHAAAHYFTSRAEIALKGETPDPAMPADFGIERSDAGTMMEARAKLMQAIQTYKGTDKQPFLVIAHVAFDAWLDQAAENKVGPDLTAREAFIEAMSRLEAPLAETRRYGIFFDPGHDVLSDGAQTIIDDAVDFIVENPGKPYSVTLIDKNAGVHSAARMGAVQAALAAKGVPAGSIATASTPVQQPVPGGYPATAAGRQSPQDSIEVVVSFTGAPPSSAALGAAQPSVQVQ